MTINNSPIALLLPTLHSGGAEKQLYYLIKHWPKKEEIILYYFNDDNWTDLFISLGIRVIKIDWKKCNFSYAGYFINYYRKAIALKKKLIHHDINTIYTWLFDANLVGLLISFNFPIKHISSVRFGNNHYLKKPITIKNIVEYFLYYFILRKSVQIITNSHSGKNMLVNSWNVPSEKINVIYNGVDIPKKKNIRSERVPIKMSSNIRIGFVGRLDKIKNPYLAIDAISLLDCKNKINLEFYGREDNITQNELKHYGRNKFVKIKCFGHVDNIWEQIKQINIIISTSNTEGTSNVIIEALLHGIPVVASDVGDNKLLLSDKRGIIVPPNDQKLFCEALKYYIYNHDVMIEPRMNYIKNKFSLLNMVDKTRTTLIKYSQ